MSIMSKVLRQCRKPTGWLGRIVVRGMNMGHSEMTNWGLGHISIRKNDTILDVGCGGGGTIRKLARIATEGKVHGIDYSEESVRISTKTNRGLIEAGRVKIRHGSVSSLPYPDSRCAQELASRCFCVQGSDCRWIESLDREPDSQRKLK